MSRKNVRTMRELPPRGPASGVLTGDVQGLEVERDNS